MIETKTQRIARKFGTRPAKGVPSNGVNGRIHSRARKSLVARPRAAHVSDVLLNRIYKQFSVGCTNCFAATLHEMSMLAPTEIVSRSEDFAKSIYENAKERGATNLLAWANYQKNGLRLYEQLILDACESFVPAPAVDATFVWLYFDGEKQSDELRWSIRSVLANYKGTASVIVFGDRPSWYCGPHVPIKHVVAQHRRRYRDTLNKMHTACTSPLIPDTFVWMMDDTYFLRQVAFRDLAVNRYRANPGRPWGSRSGFGGVQSDAYEALRKEGMSTPDFCTHLPKVVEKEKFLQIWNKFDLAHRVLAWEVLYSACFYENYRPVDEFFGLILHPHAIKKIRWATIINNGTRGWTERLRAELWNRFAVQSEYETSPGSPPNWPAAGIPSRRYNYEIKEGYRCRAENNVGIAVPDAPQRNVYAYAASIPGVESVIDWGTGSGAKLVEFFSDRKTIGVDVPEKVSAASLRFPDHAWRVLPIQIDCDLLIVADVIEHLADPLALIETIRTGKWKHCVISTPERDLARGVNDMGPPKNPRHVREWNSGEFVRFIRKQEIGTVQSVQVLGEYNLTVHLRRE